jgi:hypothetical protein
MIELDDEYVEEMPSAEEIAQIQEDIEQSEWENHRHNYYCLSLFDFI